MRISLKFFLTVTFLLTLFTSIQAQRKLGVRPTESGGPLIYEQAAYDVQEYDITARVFPEEKKIVGETLINVNIVAPTNWFVFDLDTPFEIANVSYFSEKDFVEIKFKRDGGKIWAKFLQTLQPGENTTVRIAYSGNPRIAPKPPWVGGFMWEKTADGSDWIVNAQQNDGADLWFPIKDHPSDEPNSVELHITVPENLFVASVGKIENIDINENSTKTYHWKMSNSINNYNIVLNIAPYKIVAEMYTSVAGETFPIKFYALPESEEKAKDIVDQTIKFLKFYEKYLGPYPYRTEKLGIAETPHLGMEHSTVIAYGNEFKKDKRGFDWLMLHELGHEWWGNMVTASDWRDMWIHEGFQSFMDALYLEETKGKEAYLDAMRARVKNTRNMQAVAPREPRFAYQVYLAAPDYVKSDGDIYGKGSLILHTLRYLIGDKAFFKGLRRMAYPTKQLETYTDGRQNRFVTTDDVKQIFEEESKMDLDWFFEVYLRQPELPSLVIKQVENGNSLRWQTPNDLPFPMPIEIEINGETKRINMKQGRAEIRLKEGASVFFDKNRWILKKGKQSKNMKTQFEGYFKAINDHEIEKALSFLSDEFQLHFTEFNVNVDKKSYVDVLGWDKGANGRVSYEDLIIEDNTIKGIFTEKNDFLRILRINELKANIAFEFDEFGKISRQIYTPLPNQPSFQEKLQSVVKWARQNRPDELDEIYPQNQMKFNQKMAERWVRLLQEWEKSKAGV
ncbi:MAG: M1 family metallopeptidase [Pyrinomonadaceae bacterium]|nr:M1 family metallopeptidase [Pyrinomonadaceae bacterium]